MNTAYPDICPAADKCGGCKYQGVPYEKQLEEKAEQVRTALKASGLDVSIFAGIEGCPRRYAYRNKMEYTFGNEFKGGPMQLGMHRKGSYRSIVNTHSCQIVPEDFNRIAGLTLSFCEERGYGFYDKKLHRGLMRCLILRHGLRTNQLLINIVTSTDGDFDASGYADYLLSNASCFDNDINGILHTVNNHPSDAVTPEEIRFLYGDPFYFEVIMGLSFKVGAFSFFQTNVEAAERLYRDAIALVPDIEGKTVFDLYCGTGTISQAMASRAGAVVGVELSSEAVESAKINAAINGLSNCHFFAGDVEEVLETIPVKPDVIVVDPPRSGIAPKALRRIFEYGAGKIVYVSCNPKTLAENLRGARLHGYEVLSLRAYDNFAFTGHVEACAQLSKNTE